MIVFYYYFFVDWFYYLYFVLSGIGWCYNLNDCFVWSMFLWVFYIVSNDYYDIVEFLYENDNFFRVCLLIFIFKFFCSGIYLRFV